MTLDEKAIIRLTSRRTILIDVATAKVKRLDGLRSSIVKDTNAKILVIDNEIKRINSAPRCMRPKKALTETQQAYYASRRGATPADRNYDQDLANQIAARRDAASAAVPDLSGEDHEYGPGLSD